MSMFWTFTWVCSSIYSFSSFASFGYRIALINNPKVKAAARAIFVRLFALSVVLIPLAFPILYIVSTYMLLGRRLLTRLSQLSHGQKVLLKLAWRSAFYLLCTRIVDDIYILNFVCALCCLLVSHLKLKLEDDSSGIIQEILMNFFRIWVESFWQQQSLHLFVTPFPFLLALLALLTPAANSQELERLLILPAAGWIHRGYLRPIMRGLRAKRELTDKMEDVRDVGANTEMHND